MATAGANVSGPDQRNHRRREFDLPVTVTEADSHVQGEICFDARDLSVGGAFLRADLLFEVGEVLDLSFQLPGSGVVRARGKVVRVVRDAGPEIPGMGIAFTELTDGDRDAVRAFLSS